MALFEYDIIPDGGSNCFSVSGAGDLRITDANWALEPVGDDWLWCGWVKLTSKSTQQILVGKYANNGSYTDNRSYLIYYQPTATDRFGIVASTNGTAGGNVTVYDSVLGSPSTGVWYFIEAGRIGSTLSIRATSEASGSRNSATTTAYAGNTFNAGCHLGFGAFYSYSGTSIIALQSPLSGQLDEWLYWQGTLPSSGELDQIFNAGAGISKREFIDAGIRYPSAAFTLDETSSTRFSWDRTRSLSPSGTTSYAAGKVANGDFTSISTAIAYAQSNKVDVDQWIFTCYSGNLEPSSANFYSIATTTTGTVEFIPAVGAEHNGTFDNKLAASFSGLGYYYVTDGSSDYLDPAAGDFVCTAWVLLTDKTNYSLGIGKYTGSVSPTNQRSWILGYDYTTDRFNITGSTNGTTNVTVLANNFGAVSTGTWYFIEFGRESGNLFIAVNRGTRDTTAFAGTFFNGTSSFFIGYYNGYYHKGLVDEVYYWTSLSGSLPDSTDLDVIYNSGIGICKREFIEQGLPTPYDAWSFEYRDSFTASWGTHAATLTQSGTVGYEIGHIEEDKGAYITAYTAIQQNDLKISRLQFENEINIYNGDDLLLDGNLAVYITAYSYNVLFTGSIQNNLIICKDFYGIYLSPFIDDSGSYVYDVDIINNTVIDNNGTASTGLYVSGSASPGTIAYSGTVANNIFLENIGMDFGVAGHTVTNNITGDVSGDIPSETFASTFIDAANQDYTPLFGGAAYRAGTSILAYDIEETARHSTPDVGAYESPGYVAVVTGGLELGGDGLLSVDYETVPTGGLVLGGVSTLIVPPLEFDIVPDGGSNCFSVSGAGDLRITDSNWAFEPGTTNWLWAGWVKLSTLAANQAILCKWNTTSNQRTYQLTYDTTPTDRFALKHSHNGTTEVKVTCDVLGVPTADVWYFFEISKVSTTLSIRVTSEATGTRNAADTGVSATTTSFNSTADFMLGARLTTSTRDLPLSGQIDEVYYWQGALPTSGELDDIYNAGAGISKRELIDAGILYPSCAFTLDESSGNRYSWDRTKLLVPNGTTSYSTGKVANGDFTSISTAVAYAAANKADYENWIFTCHSGNLEPSSASFSGMATLPTTGTVDFIPAVGAEHNGTFEDRQSVTFGATGATGYLTISDGSWGLEPTTNNWMWAGWVKLDDISNYHVIISKHNNTSNQRSYSLFYSIITGQLGMTFSSNGSSETSLLSAVTVSNGVWYFVEFGRISGSMSIRVTPASSSTRNSASTTTGANIFNSTAALIIGTRLITSTPADPMRGQVDELYYWQTTLPSDTELDDMFNAGVGITKKQFVEQGLLTPDAAFSFESRSGTFTSWDATKTFSQVGTVGYDIGHIEEDRGAYVTAYTSIQQDDINISRLQFENEINIYYGENIVLDGNLLVAITAYPYNGFFTGSIQNNLIICNGFYGINFAPFIDDSGSYNYDVNVVNNTVIDNNATAFYGLYVGGSASPGILTYSGTVANNIFLESIGMYFGVAGHAVTNNITGDGSGDIGPETFASTFVDADNQDYMPLFGGAAYRAGTSILTYDIEETARHPIPDIGAYESPGFITVSTGDLLLGGEGLLSVDYETVPTGGLVLGGVSELIVPPLEFDIVPDGGSNCFSVSGAGYLSITDANWAFEPGTTNWLWAGWVKLTSKASAGAIVAKFNATGNQKSYVIQYSSSADRFNLVVSSDGSATSSVAADVLGSPSTGIWYFFEAGRVSGSLSIRVTPDSSGSRNAANTTTGVNAFNSTAIFSVGGYLNTSTLTSPLSGQIDEVYYWQNTIPSSGELDDIYNAGAGISKREFIDAGILYPSAAFTLDEASGSRYSWDRTRLLVPNGTTSYSAGKVANGDFTSISTAVAYAQANKADYENWIFTCHSGNLESSSAGFASIPTLPVTGTIDFIPAVGAEHNGTFEAKQAVSFMGSGNLSISDGSWNLEPGANDWLHCGWVKLATKNSFQTIIYKYDGASSQRSYSFAYDNVTDRFNTTVSSDGGITNIGQVSANNLGSPSTGVWYFYEVGRIGSTISLRVTSEASGTRGTANTVAYGFANTFNSNQPFIVGGPSGFQLVGQMDEIYYWQTTLPSSGDLDDIFNAGAGISKKQFIEQGILTPNAAFSFENTSGIFTSWDGTKTLSQSGTIGYDIGHIEEDKGAYVTAYTSISQDNLNISRLQFENEVNLYSGENIVLDGNMILAVTSYPYNVLLSATIQNNLIICNGFYGIYFSPFIDDGGSYNYDINVINNTVIDNATAFYGLYVSGSASPGTLTYSGTVANNIFLESIGMYFDVAGHAVTNNITGDVSGDIPSETFASTFTDAANQDYTPLFGGAAYRTGTPFLTYDIEETARHSIPDIGAYESPGFITVSTGDLLLGGEGLLSVDYVTVPTGGLVLGGSSIITVPPLEFDIIPDGGRNSLSINGAGHLYITDGNWGLEPGSSDWLWCGWVKLTSKATQQVMIAKYAGTGENRSYLIQYSNSADRFNVAIHTLGTAASGINMNDSVLGSPSTGVWYFVEAGRVSGNLSLRVTSEASGSRNAANTGSAISATYDGTAAVAIGAFADPPTTGIIPITGQMDQWMYWQDTLPSSGELDSIFNGGAGLSKREFIDAGIRYPSAAFALDEISGNRYSWDRTKQAIPAGTTSYSTAKIASGDFTSISSAVAYAVANKIDFQQWIFTCHTGNLESSSASFNSIPTTSIGTVDFIPAVGAEHNGTFENRQAAAFGNNGYFYISDASAGDLDPASGDFVIGAWVLLTDLTSTFKIASKLQDSGNLRSYTLYFNSGGSRFVLYSTPAGDGAGSVSVTANNFGAPSAGQWYFVEAGRQSGNVFIAVNRGTRDTAAFAGTYFNNSVNFEVGRFNGVNSNGLIDELYFWHSSGSLPTTGDLDDIYNSGIGITKKAFIEQALPMPYDAWSFEYLDGFTNSWGTAQHTLTQSGTIGYEVGHIEEDRAAYITAYTYIQQDNLVLRRLQFETEVDISSGENILLDGNLFVYLAAFPYNTSFSATFQNNLIICNNFYGIYSSPYVDDGGDYVYDLDIINNTVIDNNGAAFYGLYVSGSASPGSVAYTGTVANNIFLENFGMYFDVFGHTVTNNITGDGSGDIPSETFASTFVDGDNQDYTPITSGPAYRTGLALVDYDIEENARHTPQDIGAYESLVTSVDTEIIPSGGMVMGGDTEMTVDYGIAPTGGLVLAGDTEMTVDYSIDPLGGLVLGGDTDVTQGFTRIPSGGMVLAGDTEMTVDYSIDPSGGMVLAGDAEMATEFTRTPSGGMVLAGDPEIVVDYVVALSGGVVLAGDTEMNVDYGITPDGGLVLAGAVDYYEYEPDGGEVETSGDAETSLFFIIELDIEWDIQSLLIIDSSFYWDVGIQEARWYRVQGCCKYPTSAGDGGGGAAGGCDVIGLETDDASCTENSKQQYIQNIVANGMTDLCEKIQASGMRWEICSIKRYSRPADASLIESDDNCNVLTEVPFCEIPACMEFCIQTDAVIKMTMEVVADIIYVYEGSGEVQTSGAAITSTDGTAGSVYYEYEPDGGEVVISGEAITESSWDTDLLVDSVMEISVIGEEAIFAVTPDSSSIPEITNTVSTNCGVCAEMPLVLSLTHNLSKAGNLVEFLQRNGLKIPNTLTMHYSSRLRSWTANYHLTGVGDDNLNSQEQWRLSFEWACVNEVAGVDFGGSSYWKFSMLVRRYNATIGTDFDTRLVIIFPPGDFCDGNENFAFDFSFKVNTMTYFVENDVIALNEIVLADNIGLFKSAAWVKNPILKLQVTKKDGESESQYQDIYPIFPKSNTTTL